MIRIVSTCKEDSRLMDDRSRQPTDWGFSATPGLPGRFRGNFDFQFARVLGSAADGGAALGECYETASRIVDEDMESFTVAWSSTAERIELLADKSLAGGHRVSAREAYLRASGYWRTAGFYLPHSDGRCRTTWERQRDCFRRAAQLMPHPAEPVS